MSARSVIARALAPMVLTISLACGGGASDSTSPPPGGTGGPGGTEGQLTHPAGILSGKINVTGGPYGIAVSPGGMAMVTLHQNRAIAQFSTSTPNVQRPELEIGPDILDIVMNKAGTTAYVAAGKGVSTIEVASGREMSTVPMGFAYRLALSPDETRLYATGGQGKLWSMPTTPGGAPTVAVTMPRGLWGIAMSPSGKSLYVASDTYVTWRVDPATLAITATNLQGGVEMGDVLVSPDEKEVYLVVDSGDLWILDATTLERLGYVDVGHGSLAMTLTPDGTQIYVTSWGGRVTIVDRAKRSVVATLTVGGLARDVAFDKLGKTAYVANESDWIDVIK